MNSKHPTSKIHPILQGNSDLTKLYNAIIKCKNCPRIVDFRTKIAREKRRQFIDWTYWGKAVPGYGDPGAQLMIVGLAPAAHGGNRTARVFTGDKSADFLMMCLHEVGFANQENSDAVDDGLILNDAFMTPILKCVPPQDKPTADELKTCFTYFNKEMELLNNVKIILALGKIAFDGCLKYFRQFYELKVKEYPFGHDVSYIMPNGIILHGSYHPSPRNVNTKRLTKIMMLDLLNKVKTKRVSSVSGAMFNI